MITRGGLSGLSELILHFAPMHQHVLRLDSEAAKIFCMMTVARISVGSNMSR